jgi:ubiquinone biosynthesis protein
LATFANVSPGIPTAHDRQDLIELYARRRNLKTTAVNKLVMGMITSALFLGSAMLWSNRVPPMWGGYSMAGVLGCAVSIALGLRLLTKIWRE